MLYIRIGLNADPDPAFYLKADPFPCQDLPAQKVEFLHKKFTLYTVGNRS